MRESKFRAWIPQAKEWIDDISLKDLWKSGQALEAHGTSRYEAENIQGIRWTFDDLVIEQFTGRRDEQGTEIYEGDILENWRAPHLSKMVMVFSEEEAAFLPELVDQPGATDRRWVLPKSGWVVCGNIHENPELVKHG